MQLPRLLYKIFWLPFYRFYALRHIQKDRICRSHGLQLNVPKDVFHPGIFLATPIFLDFLGKTDLNGCTVADIGTGCGAIALFAAQKGAVVTAVDINPAAVEAARNNAILNQLPLQCFQSDLFGGLSPTLFQYILANPPYYPAQPSSDADRAFFAGEGLEYFQRFFKEARPFMNEYARIWMILSEDCNWPFITEMALNTGFSATKIYEKRVWGEWFFVGEFRFGDSRNNPFYDRIIPNRT